MRGEDTGEFKILGTSSWSGQASEGVYTPKSVSGLDYETIYYQSDLGEFPAYLTNEGDVGIVILFTVLEEITQGSFCKNESW